MRVYSNIHEAYLGTLEDVWENYDYKSAPRGLPIREKLDYRFRVLDPIAESIITMDEERNKVIKEYTKKEMDLYSSLTNRVEDFSKASTFWNQIANPDGTVNSAYGYLIWENKSHGNEKFEGKMRTPWEWCVESLIKDKDTRQAIMRFSLPEHQWTGNKDQTCTLHGNWVIRNDRLHLTIVMRSNDLNKGLLYDLPFFVHLMDTMLERLKPIYSKLSKGYYTHFVHSLHIYEKDEKTIMKMRGM